MSVLPLPPFWVYATMAMVQSLPCLSWKKLPWPAPGAEPDTIRVSGLCSS